MIMQPIEAAEASTGVGSTVLNGLALVDSILNSPSDFEDDNNKASTWSTSLFCKRRIEKLSLGCPVLDGEGYFRGGLPTRNVIEIVGESASCKTQVCLQLCKTVQYSIKEGGLGGSAIYVSTEDLFPSKRMQQMVSETENCQPEQYLNNILLDHSRELEEFEELLFKRIPIILGTNNYKEKPIKLIVIDSIAALVRSEFQNTESPQRAQILHKIATKLKDIAETHNLVIVIVNQVSSVFQEEEPSSSAVVIMKDNNNCQKKLKPALGLLWSNMINMRIEMQKTSSNIDDCQRNSISPKTQRIMSLEFSSYLPSFSVPVQIDNRGVSCVDQTTPNLS